MSPFKIRRITEIKDELHFYLEYQEKIVTNDMFFNFLLDEEFLEVFHAFWSRKIREWIRGPVFFESSGATIKSLGEPFHFCVLQAQLTNRPKPNDFMAYLDEGWKAKKRA